MVENNRARSPGVIFFNVTRGAIAANGIPSWSDDFAESCKEYLDFMVSIQNVGSQDAAPLSGDPVALVNEMVGAHGLVTVRKINHPRAVYEILSRRKKTGLSDAQLTNLEKFYRIDSDDTILWKMRVDDAGTLVFAGVALYGESDIDSHDPNFSPGHRQSVQRLGRARKLKRPPTP